MTAEDGNLVLLYERATEITKLNLVPNLTVFKLYVIQPCTRTVKGASRFAMCPTTLDRNHTGIFIRPRGCFGLLLSSVLLSSKTRT